MTLQKALLIAAISAASLAMAQQRLQPKIEESAAQDVPNQTPVIASSGLSSTSQNLNIGPGDLIAINVFETPELTTLLRVSNSGEISYPLLGNLHVAGLSSGETEQLIAKRLREGRFVLDPQVSVMVREYATQAVSVLGEVRKPGAYPILGAHSLLDVLTAAGGLTNSAGSVVSITPAGSSQPAIVHLNTTPGESWKANPLIAPGDRIEIARAPIVYVMGEVGRPGGFVMTEREKLTLLKALALAEGTKPTAALSKARLLRKTSGGIQDTRVSLKQILAGKAPDIELQDSDLVFVPNSSAKSFAARTAETLIAAASSGAVYGAMR